jgi:hypothetical protein
MSQFTLKTKPKTFYITPKTVHRGKDTKGVVIMFKDDTRLFCIEINHVLQQQLKELLND